MTLVRQLTSVDWLYVDESGREWVERGKGNFIEKSAYDRVPLPEGTRFRSEQINGIWYVFKVS